MLRWSVSSVICVGAALAGVLAKAEPKTVEIAIEHFAFSPSNVAVNAGDTIMFVNKDIVPHTATATDSSWTTGELAHGASARVTLPAQAGVDFHCRFHPAMKGHLTIAPMQ
jgi:plastocyanin